jgi:hypothetical protein
MRLKTTITGFAVVALSVGIYIAVLALVAVGLSSYPPILITSLAIIGAELLIINRIGLVSVPSIFWAFVSVPALVPFLSNYVLFTPNYTLRAMAYSDPGLIRKGVFLVAVFVWIVAGISIARLERPTKSQSSPVGFVSAYTFPYTLPAFVIVSGIVLFSAYLTTPGPTILTHDYAVAKQSPPWATFAGSLFMGSWIVLLLLTRQTNRTAVTYAFYLITVATLLWLLLHARRNETVGVLLTILVTYGHRFRLRDLGSSLRTTLFTAVFTFGFIIQIVIGKVRSGSGGIDIRSILIGSSPNGEVVKLPGGGHNIFGTYQFTLHHFAENSFLFGTTFVKYPVQSIPTNITRVLGISQPAYYFNLMQAEYPLYNGGNYLLNEFFANFGSFGIILAAILFGLVVAKVHELLANSKNPTLWTGIAAVFVVAMPRAMWYWQGNWINVFQGILITYMLYLTVTNLTRDRYLKRLHSSQQMGG